MENKKFRALRIAAVLIFLTASMRPVFSQTAPTLSTAQSFAILGSSTVTSTGPTVINGDLGLSPGLSVVGFPPGIVNGTIHAGDAAAGQAKTDANVAYNSLAVQACTSNLSGQDLGGMTLIPGVYCFNTSAQLTGTLVLDAQGNPNAVFIFQIGSTLTTASNSAVLLINSAAACNVFFQVGSSATLGTNTQFIGNIFALASVTLTTAVNLSGRAVALNGAVTLDTNVVSVPFCSVPPTTGFVQICKVAGAGVTVGTNFTFNVAGTSVAVAAGPAPGGTCSPPLVAPAGAMVITETVPVGTVLAGVSTFPAGLLVSSNLAAGTATVTVNAGGQTIVTFIDTVIPPTPNTGFVQVCKVAGAGVAVGTNFTFSVAGTPVTIAAGPAPGGTCSAALPVPAGPTTITESLPAGTALTSVSTLPTGLLVNSNLAAGMATVTVNAGGQTIVTFIDTIIPTLPNTGFVQICKVAGAGVIVGTNFTFSVGGTPVTVAAGPAPGGRCSSALTVPAGNIIITEILPAATTLTGVSTLPVGLLVSSNLALGTATVTVNAGGQTIVTFIDAVTLPTATTGFLQICKVAGTGVAVGTNFTFSAAGNLVTVPAGPAPGGNCSAALVVPAGPMVVTEALPGGTTLTSLSALPRGSLLSATLSAGTATVTVTAGAQTVVTFTNAAIPAAYLIRYLSNLNLGDSVINITNSGAAGAGLAAGTGSSTTGAFCANIYAFSPDEQMVACCSCPVTPNGLVTLSARTDLVNNTLTPAVPTSLVVKLVASVPAPGSLGCAGSAANVNATNLSPGIAAWGTTVHVGPLGALGITETPFLSGSLTTAAGNAGDIGELARLAQLCTFINANGSGFGICRPCRLGALGAGRM